MVKRYLCIELEVTARTLAPHLKSPQQWAGRGLGGIYPPRAEKTKKCRRAHGTIANSDWAAPISPHTLKLEGPGVKSLSSARQPALSALKAAPNPAPNPGTRTLAACLFHPDGKTKASASKTDKGFGEHNFA
jgi:hypothetical protein